MTYYSRNGITILHGDARELAATVRADTLITDPPYGTGDTRRHAGKLRRTRAEWDTWSLEHVPKLPQGALFVPPRRIPEAAAWAGASWRLLAWVSPNPVARKGVGPRYGIQPIVGWGLRAPEGALDWLPHRSNIATPAHPHQKPDAVLRWLVGLTAGTILDPYMGTGTTLRAALDHGRRAVGIELDERLCELAARSLAQAPLPFEGSS